MDTHTQASHAAPDRAQYRAHYRARNPFIAAAMSLVLPGFGQLYNGQVNKAIWLFLIFALLAVPGEVLVALYLPSGMMFPTLLLALLVTLGIWLYGIVNAWRTARRLNQSPGYQSAPWQSTGMYMAVLLLCDFIALPLLLNYVQTHQVQSFHFPLPGKGLDTPRFGPNIMAGDTYFIDKRYNCPACKQAIKRGDFAFFIYPNDRTLYYGSRIIGLPGDRVQIEGNDVAINGVSIGRAKPDANGMQTERQGNRQWQVRWGKLQADVDLTVPNGQVFVLSDERGAPYDSRWFGTVPLADITGKVHQVWLSWDQQGIRWSRLGKIMEPEVIAWGS